MLTITKTTADAAWRAAARRFRDGRGVRRQASRDGHTLELSQVAFVLTNPRERWILSREPAMNPAYAIAEVVWILTGRNDSAFVNFWNPGLPKFAGRGRKYHGAYGHRLRWHFQIDQIERAYRALSHNPESRQVVLQIWDAASDLPSASGQPVSQDVPCNICSMLKVRESRLEWTQIMRSNDFILGLPHNFVQFTYLQEFLAAWLGLDLGSYTHLSDSLHVYMRNGPSLTPSRRHTWPENTDRWDLKYSPSMRCLHGIANRMDGFRRHRSPSFIERTVSLNEFPPAAQNLLRTVAADAARRRGDSDVATAIMTSCTNRVLAEAWRRWSARQSRRKQRSRSR